MKDYLGEDVAATYDQGTDDTATAEVDVLARLAGPGRALEFGVGTGRVALPLAGRGVPVVGIDLSEAMVDRLRAKLRDQPGADAVTAVIGDFAGTRVDGTFAVVYLVFNTISNLTSQDAQVDCFVNAARHLEPGGCFVIENGVPSLRLLPPGQTAVPFRAGPDGWAYDLFDCSDQSMSSNYPQAVDGELRVRSIPFRYTWPAELDLMARIAGLRLRDRWEDWHGTPFGHESRGHVSVWEKPAAG